MAITKQLLGAVRIDMNAALQAVAEKHGLKSLMCGKCTYDPTAGSFTMKVEGIAEGGVDKRGALYLQMQEPMNLPPLGAEFNYGREPYITTGLNTTGTKVIAKRKSDGKSFLIPADAVKAIVAVGAKQS